MKKQYEVPQIEIEEFEMEYTLCDSCGTTIGEPGSDTDPHKW